MYNIKQKLLVTSLVCGSVILNSNFAMAQETEQVPTFQLQEMVVTATKTLKELKDPSECRCSNSTRYSRKKCKICT